MQNLDAFALIKKTFFFRGKIVKYNRQKEK